MALIKQKAEHPLPMDRHLVEWLLFMLVAILSFRAAWIMAEGHTYDFFWQAWDGLGYYQWLPSAFITGKFDWMFWCKKIADLKAISMYSLGVSVLELPFFLASQVLTWFFGYPNTGFSPPNAVFMMVSTATYAGAGAVLSFKLARRFSNTPAALLAVVSIYAGTNLFYYATREPLMSHVYSYFLIALFCWCSLRIIDGPRRVHVILFLFSGALLVLVRQLNVVVFVFPLWMAWASPGGIKGAWGHLMGHPGGGGNWRDPGAGPVVFAGPLLASSHRSLVCEPLFLRGRNLRMGQDGAGHGALQPPQWLVRLQPYLPLGGWRVAGGRLAEYAHREAPPTYAGAYGAGLQRVVVLVAGGGVWVSGACGPVCIARHSIRLVFLLGLAARLVREGIHRLVAVGIGQVEFRHDGALGFRCVLRGCQVASVNGRDRTDRGRQLKQA